MVGKVVALIFMTLLLSACGVKYSEIETPPLNITPTNVATSKGLDIYAAARTEDDTAVPRFRGTALVEIRTNFKEKAAKTTKEFIGADCVLNGQEYTAEFKTPQHVLVPIYGEHSAPLFVKCNSDIGLGTQTSEIYNYTTAVRNQHAPSGGLLGVLIVTAINAAREDPESDQYKYQNIYIDLNAE